MNMEAIIGDTALAKSVMPCARSAEGREVRQEKYLCLRKREELLEEKGAI